MADFKRSKNSPEKIGSQSREKRDQGGVSPTGFADAPVDSQDRGHAGPGVPPNKKKIH